MQPSTLTAAEVARTLDVRPGTIRHWIRSGKLPAKRERGRYAIARNDVLRLLQEMRERMQSAGEARFSFKDAAGVFDGPEDLSSAQFPPGK
ncbi:helix-turn-helix domain-containing protein [bacterium]|nr:helix-turn-helix domain-containing protein [bacterium]